MSNVHPTSQHFQPPTDLAALAVTLQETAQALLAFCPEKAPNQPKIPAQGAACPNRDGETRSYYFSPAALEHEKELLRKYQAEDFQALLAQVYVLLIGLVKLMKSVHQDVRVKGYVIASLGCLLEQACSLVLRMRNVYDRVTPVQGRNV